MNLALSLTLARLFSVPVVLWLLFHPTGSLAASAAVFGAAALTDLLDGQLARSRGEVTTLGMLLDPIADKCLVLALLFAFSLVGLVPLWMVVMVTIRDVAVTAVRLWRFARRGEALAAHGLGKHKTVWQMVTIAVLFGLLMVKSWGLLSDRGQVAGIAQASALFLMWVVLVLSVVSGIEFFMRVGRQRSVKA